MNDALAMLVLITCANGAPVVAALILGDRFAWPVDGGRRLWDGRPWLGASKTWRGILAAVLVTPPIAVGLGLSWLIGLIAAAGAMLGDCLASLIKRRLGRPPKASLPLLDQIPEALIPLLLLKGPVGLSPLQIVAVVLAFTLIDLVLTPVAGRLRRRLHSEGAGPR